MKTAVWLYLFMFVALFDLHAQYPILTPFALSLGAAPSFIGLIMGVYSITHLPGNLLAGYGVDRYGSRWFISASLTGAGVLLVLQSKVTDPWQLLAVRSVSGFVLAFLSPACMAMLAKLAQDRVHQSRLMSGNGLVHTLASVVSPAVGAILVGKLGFAASFTVLGWGLVAIGLLSAAGIRELRHPSGEGIGIPARPHSGSASASEGIHTEAGRPGRIGAYPAPAYRTIRPEKVNTNQDPTGRAPTRKSIPDGEPLPWLLFGLPLGLSCAQGILYFELPLLKTALHSIMTSGWLFTVISLGALFSLSLVFLNRVSAYLRTVCGSLLLALVYFGMAVNWPLPLPVSLFLIGAAKGAVFPAISALLAGISAKEKYGRVFSLLSISFSVGAFFGPLLAGHFREDVSPFFLAFLALMAGLLLMPLSHTVRAETA